MAGFGGAVKLTGESEYKNALKEITRNLKEVSSEMKLVSSQYARNDTSMAALTAKQDVLNKKLTEQKNKLQLLKTEYQQMQSQYSENRQKHEQLVQTYNKESAKLKELENTVGVTSDEYKAQEKVVAELEKEVMKSSQAMDQNEKAMSQMRIAINNAEADVNKTTNAIDELDDEMKKSADDADDLGEAMDDAADGSQKASGGFTVMKGVLANLVADGIRLAIEALKDFARQTLQTGIDFDRAMAEVAAISGATGEELQLLRDTAKEFGSSTMFSASQSAEALKYMSLAGWDAKTSTEALGGVLDLAAASGMELGAASDMVTDYLSAFGLEAKESAYFADLLAYAQANANTTVEGLGEAFRNVAPNMAAAGQDIETTTSLLSMMANQGLKGSESGTALAAVMRDLTKKMQDGKIAIGETAVEVMDASGNYRDLTDILLDVEAATQGMGDAEKASALASTFTADSIKGLNIILNAGVENAASFEDELRSCTGTASEMAATMQDNLGGDLTALSSQFEGVQIALFEKFEPALRKGVDALSSLLDALSFVIDHSSEFVTALTAMAAGVGAYVAYTTAITVMTEGWMALTVVQKAVAAGQWLVNAAMAANPIGLIIAAVAALVAGFIYLWKTNEGFRKSVLKVWNAIKKGVLTAVNGIKNFIKNTFPNIGKTVTDVWEKIKSVTQTAWNGFKMIVSTALKYLQPIITFYLNVYKTAFTVVFNIIKTIVTTVFTVIKTIVTTVLKAVDVVVNTYLRSILNVVTTVFNTIKTVTQTAWNGAKTIVTTAVNGIKSTVSSVFNAIKSNVQTAWNGVKSITTSVWNGIKSAITTPLNAAKNAVKKIVDTIKGFFNFSFKLPHIPLPHFSISPAGWKIGDLLKGKIPSLSIKWYQRGGVFDSPTLLAGIGENGAEAVVPLEKNTMWIKRVAQEMASFFDPFSGLSETVSNIYNPSAMDYSYNQIVDAFKDALSQMTVELDDDQVGRFVIKTVENAVYR